MANALKGVLSGDEERSEENEQDRMGRDDEDDSQRSSLKGQGNVEQDTDPSVKEQASGSTEASEQIKPSGFTVFVRGLPLGTRRGQLYRFVASLASLAKRSQNTMIYPDTDSA